MPAPPPTKLPPAWPNALPPAYANGIDPALVPSSWSRQVGDAGHRAPNAAVRSNRGLAIALAVLVPLWTIMGAAALALDSHDIEVSRPSPERIEAVDGAAPFGAIELLLGLAAIVVGLVWSFRVARNARAMSYDRKPSPGWALGSWFIPVGNVLTPVFPMNQAWRASRAGSPSLIFAWSAAWVLWMATALASRITSAAWSIGQGSDVAVGATVVVELPAAVLAVGWVGQALMAVAALLFLLVVFGFERAHRAVQPSRAGSSTYSMR